MKGSIITLENDTPIKSEHDFRKIIENGETGWYDVPGNLLTGTVCEVVSVEGRMSLVKVLSEPTGLEGDSRIGSLHKIVL